jgi:hypothetical protein
LSVVGIVSDLEAFPFWFRDIALTPLREVAELNERVTISRPVVIAVPVNKDTNGGKTNISTNDEVSGEDPWGDDGLVATKLRKKSILLFSGRLVHDLWVGRVEGEGGGWEAVGDQVDPEELDGVETVRDTEDG